MNHTFPRSLPFDGRIVNHAGPGRPAGSALYIDPSRGETLEVYGSRIVGTGPHFALAEVVGNPALPKVRVDHRHFGRTLAIGEAVLVGSLHFEPAGPRAGCAWPAPASHPPAAPPRAPHAYRPQAHPAPRPSWPPQLEIGVVAGGSRVVAERSGEIFTVPPAAWRHGPVPPGSRVVFRAMATPGGLFANDVRLA
jgi:hypothetical protein